MMDELNEKLIAIEREKQAVYLELQKIDHLRESDQKLREAERRIDYL